MRLTPAQVGMTLLLGGFVARLSTGDLKADIRRGREWLVRIGGGQHVRAGMNRSGWAEAVRVLEAEEAEQGAAANAGWADDGNRA